MEEFEITIEDMLAISQLYEKIICHVHIGDEIFLLALLIEVRMLISTNFFVFCVDELVTIKNILNILLLYVNDVVLFANTLEMPKSL